MTYYTIPATGETYDFAITAPSGSEWVRLSNAAGKKARSVYARSQLLKILKPGDTVNCVLRHVSRSGMLRHIDLYVGDRCISNLAADVLDDRQSRDGAIVITGCGMDMGFALVYSLCRALYPQGFGILGTTPKGRSVRPSSPQGAAQAVRRGTVFRGRNGDASGWDTDGGYALRHNWL